MDGVINCKVLLLTLSLLASASSQDLAFVTNAGVGRYTFSYNEYAVDMDGMIISGSLPPGLFSVNCLLDGQPSSTITYSLDGEVFQVDPNTGALSLQDGMELDFEESNNIQFSVNCFAPPAARSTAQVDFRVLPVNEFPPIISVRSLFVRTREDLPIGTILVSTQTNVGALATFSATDRDGGPDGELEYTLTFNENLTSFAVNQFSGTFTVTQNLDVDNTPLGFVVNVIRLTVCDIKPAVDSCPNVEVSVVITSANDNSPDFTQNIYQASILEDVSSGSIIANVSCTDADVGAGSFKNVTSSAALFNVTTHSGGQTISLSGELDYETVRVYNVSLTCFDFGGGMAMAMLVVNVIPVNDNQPRFVQVTDNQPTEEYYFAMSRLLTTGNEIGRVKAIDGDQVVGGELTYTMMENENFQIQGDGSIILDDFVYVVEGQVFELTVEVSDGEFTDSATVVITVNGVLSVPEVILVCMGALVFLVLVVFIIVFCCYCCVCCTRLIPKQRHVDVPVEVYKNENVVPDAAMMNAVPMPMPVPVMGMYDQGKGTTYMMAMGPNWGSQSIEEEASEEEEDIEQGSIVTASSRVYSPTPYLKEMVDMFKEGDAILENKKAKKK